MSTVNVRIQTLIDAQDLSRVSDRLGESLNRLSSGTRFVSPANDPAGIGNIGKYEAQLKRAQAAAVNVQNAASFTQSSMGFMDSMAKVISRMSELSQFAGDGLKSAGDIALYQAEFKELQDQLRQTIGGTTAEIGGTVDVNEPLGTYNGVVLFGPNAAGISIASGSHAGENINIPGTNLRTGSLLSLFQQDASGNYGLSVTTPGATQVITTALNELANQRSVLSGVGSRLELAADSLEVESQNITSAVSRIKDVDVASESTRLSKMHVLFESGMAMLSQANQSPKSVLKLLQS
jgi:flagellin